jgi:hypothetical protein
LTVPNIHDRVCEASFEESTPQKERVVPAIFDQKDHTSGAHIKLPAQVAA